MTDFVSVGSEWLLVAVSFDTYLLGRYYLLTVVVASASYYLSVGHRACHVCHEISLVIREVTQVSDVMNTLQRPIRRVLDSGIFFGT
jgi:hypothetical protein